MAKFRDLNCEKKLKNFSSDIKLCLIDQAYARSKSGGSLIDQAAA